MSVGLLLRAVALGLLGVVLALLLWAAVALVQVRGELEAVRADAETVREVPDPGAARDVLARASTRLQRADALLDQPGPALARHLPFLGRTVTTVGVLTEAARAAAEGGLDVATTYLAHEPLVSAGRVDLAGLTQVAAALDRAAEGVRGPTDRLSRQSLRGVPGAVTRPTAQARELLLPLGPALDRAGTGARALAGVLGQDGPTELLVVLQNNAELRATGGLVTVFAQARADDGVIEVGTFTDVEDVAARSAEAVPVPVPADYGRLYGAFQAGTTLWKNANMDPDVPTSSAVLARIAGLSTGRAPDAVVWLDAPAMAAVLAATGPVDLADGSSLSSDGAVDELLSRAYEQVEDTVEAQAQRRARLRQVADAVVGRALGGGLDLARGAAELGRAVEGRHVTVWAADVDVQSDLVEAGLAGQVTAGDGDLVSVAVHNLGGPGGAGNKLDYYSRREVRLAVELEGGSALVHQRVELRNTAPATGLPAYVAGAADPGTTTNLVVLALPRGAVDAQLQRDGAALDVAPLPSGDHAVVTDAVAVPPGGRVVWDLVYDLPVDDAYTVTLVPQPLAHDAALSVRLSGPAGAVVEESAFSGTRRLSLGPAR